MPENVTNNYADVWKSTDRKLISRVPYSNANDNENPISEEEVSPPPDDDSTYNLEDDVTPPEITPPEGSKSVSDGTGDSLDDIQTDSSEDECIIPKFLFQLPSETRALNIEFNRCLLLDLEPVSTIFYEKITEKDNEKEMYAIPYWNISARRTCSNSSTSSSTKPSSQICCKVIENIEADDESVSTDGEVNTDLSSNDNISLSMESTETEKIIPSYLFTMFENIIFFPELELCLDTEEDSKATDNDVNDLSASAVTLDEDYFTIDPDSAAMRIWIETEITKKVEPACDSRSSSEEIDKKEELCNKVLPTPDSDGSISSVTLDMAVIQKDDEDISCNLYNK